MGKAKRINYTFPLYFSLFLWLLLGKMCQKVKNRQKQTIFRKTIHFCLKRHVKKKQICPLKNNTFLFKKTTWEPCYKTISIRINKNIHYIYINICIYTYTYSHVHIALYNYIIIYLVIVLESQNN